MLFALLWMARGSGWCATLCGVSGAALVILEKIPEW